MNVCVLYPPFPTRPLLFPLLMFKKERISFAFLYGEYVSASIRRKWLDLLNYCCSTYVMWLVWPVTAVAAISSKFSFYVTRIWLREHLRPPWNVFVAPCSSGSCSEIVNARRPGSNNDCMFDSVCVFKELCITQCTTMCSVNPFNRWLLFDPLFKV